MSTVDPAAGSAPFRSSEGVGTVPPGPLELARRRRSRTLSRLTAIDAGLCPGCLRRRHVGLTCRGLDSDAMYRVLRRIGGREAARPGDDRELVAALRDA